MPNGFTTRDFIIICEHCDYFKLVNSEKALRLVERLHNKKCPKTGRTISKTSVKMGMRRQLAGKDPIHCEQIYDDCGYVMETSKNVIDISPLEDLPEILSIVSKEISRVNKGKKGLTIQHSEFRMYHLNDSLWTVQTKNGGGHEVADYIIKELGLRIVD